MIFAFKAISFFGTGLGKLTMIIAGISALIGLRAWDVSHQRNVGAKKEQVRVEQVGKKIDAKAQAARRDAERRPHDSLRQYYRD